MGKGEGWETQVKVSRSSKETMWVPSSFGEEGEKEAVRRVTRRGEEREGRRRGGLSSAS